MNGLFNMKLWAMLLALLGLLLGGCAASGTHKGKASIGGIPPLATLDYDIDVKELKVESPIADAVSGLVVDSVTVLVEAAGEFLGIEPEEGPPDPPAPDDG